MPSTVPIAERHLRVVPVGDREEAPRLSDDQVIDAFERGDSQVADLLFDRLDDVVSKTVLRVMGRRDAEHDDLVQAAFEQILHTISRGKYARACKLSSWAVCIATHVALDAIRRRQHERRYIDPEGSDELSQLRGAGPSPDQQVMVDALRRELAGLPPGTANVVILHDMVGYDLAEIAVLTGLSVSAAQSRLVRGRASLRDRMQSLFPGAMK